MACTVELVEGVRVAARFVREARGLATEQQPPAVGGAEAVWGEGMGGGVGVRVGVSVVEEEAGVREVRAVA